MKHGMLSNSLFLALTQLVERISAEAKEADYVGDFNIDLLLRNDSNSRRLKHLMANFGLHQMIYQHVLPNNQKPFAITITVHIQNMLFVLLVRSFWFQRSQSNSLSAQKCRKSVKHVCISFR